MESVGADPFSQAALAAVEDNVDQFICHCAEASGGEIQLTDALTWVLNPIPAPFVNGVLRTRGAPDLDSLIESTLACFCEKHQPMYWRVGPSDVPTHLAKMLLQHGLVLDEPTYGMALGLQTLVDGPAHPALSFERVSGTAQLSEWVTTFGRSFGFLELALAHMDWFAAWVPGDSPEQGAFLARQNGVPVGASAYFSRGGVCGIQIVATVPESQRQGIGRALTHQVLQTAREQGAHLAILHSTSPGHRLYQQMGFVDRCVIDHYLWMPPE